MFLLGPGVSRAVRSDPSSRGSRRQAVRAVALGAAVLIGLSGCSLDEQAADAVAAGAGPLGLAGVELAEPTVRPEFSLIDTAGGSFDFAAETGGELTLMYFGYTSCPDICPVHLAQLAEVLDRPGMPDATVVFVSVDPVRDTPAIIDDYLDRFDSDFIGLTGTPEQLVAAQEASNVVPAQIEDLEELGVEDYLVGHAGQLLAFAPDDRGYVIYPFGTRQSQLAADLPVLAAMTSVVASDDEAAAG